MGYGLWSTEKNERGESGRCREQTKGRGQLSLECYFRFRVTKKTCYLYFFFLMLAWLNRFGSVQSVSDFENRNRTELKIFCDFLIGLIDFFPRFGFFGYFFSIFSV